LVLRDISLPQAVAGTSTHSFTSIHLSILRWLSSLSLETPS
jgi:hypothetical protein